jgi:aldose 1-epimerase
VEEAEVAHGAGGGANVERIARVDEDDAQVIELGWGGQGTDYILRRGGEKGEYNSVEQWQNERRAGVRRNGGRGEGAMDARTQTGRSWFWGLGMILGNGWLDFGVIRVAGMLASFVLATVWGPAEAQMNKKAGVERGAFGKLDDGTAIEVFTLRNSKGAAAKIITYGGTLTELWVPDRAGKAGDVVLGFDDLKGYLGDHPHFGGVIGRYANRIAKGKFSIDGQEYTLATNNGPNTLHGGTVGFDHRVWKGEPISGAKGAAVRLTYVSPDSEEHFPGTLTATVVYTLTEDNALKIEYTATTDKPTAVNLTNHSYFNLSGGGDVLGHAVTLNASRYTPVDSTLIPTGELATVKGTAYDFTKPMTIGLRIAELAKVKELGGYDINYVVDGESGKLRMAAKVADPASGREMEVWTTEPGVQMYTGNWLDGSLQGKRGVAYGRYGAVCLETQHYPDSVNRPNFPSVILRPGAMYHSETIYKFSAK